MHMSCISKDIFRSFSERAGYVGILLAVFLAACRPSSNSKSDEAIDDQSGPEIQAREQAAAHLSALYKRIDPTFPGRGVTDYPGNTHEDIPKSYAMILLGELDRHLLPDQSEWPDLGITAGFWLLENSDLNNNGVKGWGVPVAWDAYGDGSINEANTEYTISTAIVIHALLDWMERDPGSPRREILETVEAAIEPYLNFGLLSPSGMFPYSLQEADGRYDTFNPAAYLAGQVQRFSCIVADGEQREKMRAAADLTMAALLKEKQISNDTGAWFWNYSVQEDVPNDLPHASYIAEGIETYCRNGGRLAHEFNLPLIFEHLNEFVPKNESLPIRGWPRFQKSIERPARSYDVGMAIYTSRGDPSLLPFRDRLVRSVGKFLKDGKYLRHPFGTSDVGEICVQEYESYLYAGLARYLADNLSPQQKGCRFGPLQPFGPKSAIRSSRSTSMLSGFLRIPFVEWKLSGSTAYAEFDPVRRISRVVLGDGSSIEFNDQGIPVWLGVDPDGNLTSVFREIPSGKLKILCFDASTRKQQFSATLPRVSDAELIFRGACWHLNKLYLAIYDNISLRNYLLVLSALGDGYTVEEQAVQLPLLEDPAGGTYEMIPSVYFAAHRDKLWLFGGTLRSLVSASAPTEERIPNCLRVLEVVETPDGPIALCQDRRPYPANPYFLFGSSQKVLPAISPDRVPWNLRFVDGKVKFDEISASADWPTMLAFDLRRAQQSGWMDFGINNSEGRIPWSQIYYLNGFLDILFLARGDHEFHDIVKDLIPDIRRRLDLEVGLLNQMWLDGFYFTKAFTVDRSPALFAVQTSRLLLLFERYLTELKDRPELTAYESVRSAVFNLHNHIDRLAKSGEAAKWISDGTARLEWPKSCKFYFDGTSVPFNHQNEWAYSVQRAAEKGASPIGSDYDHEPLVAAGQIINFFSERISLEGELPRSGVWDYWWGKAYDGWTAADDVSVNKPSYHGDKIKAWISFRTIDSMAALSAANVKSPMTRNRLVSSVANLSYHGRLYPFAGYELLRLGGSFAIRRDIAMRYARIGSPWETQSAAYAAFCSIGGEESNNKAQ